MSPWELFLIAVGVSMDAFAVAICKGLSVNRVNLRHAATVGLYFGGFQAAMPLIGYLLGTRLESLITSFDHWVAFALLVLIGANMVRESRSGSEELNDSFDFKTMLPLAIATSIDALAIGVGFAFLQVNIVPAVAFIGAVTLIVSGIGVKIGNVSGANHKSRAELLGGIILILIGVKILIEHLGIIG